MFELSLPHVSWKGVETVNIVDENQDANNHHQKFQVPNGATEPYQAILGEVFFPLHKPYPYSLYR